VVDVIVVMVCWGEMCQSTTVDIMVVMVCLGLTV